MKIAIATNRTCLIDPSHKTYIHKKYGTERWFRYKDGWICLKCHHKLIGNPRRTKEYMKKYNDRRTKEYIKKYSDRKTPEQIKHLNSFRFKFKDKTLRADKPLIKDKCLWCNKKIGDEYFNCKGQISIIKQIHIHHIKYHEDDPLKDTILLCHSCHMKETRRLGHK